jgi:hypothetical protein
MLDIVSNASSPQLLVLLAIPLVGAVFFSAIIVVSLNRRRKKAQMKLGTQSASSPPAPAAANDLNTSILSQPLPSAGATPQPGSPRAVSPDPLPVSAKPEAGPDISSRTSKDEVFSMDASQQANEDEVNLAARLENLGAPGSTRPGGEPVELLRLLRHPQSGQLLVEVGGERYTKLTDVVDKKIGQFILKLAAHFLAFTNGMVGEENGVKSVHQPRVGQVPLPPKEMRPQSSPPPAQAPAPPPVATASESAEPEPIIPKPPPEAEAAFLASLREQAIQPETPSSRGLFGRTKTASQPILPGLNLADEINKIVQARLVASPLAATTKLEITSDLGGGIRIKVNEKIYASPDDIPDPDVKELIKASIKQWERS